MSKKVDERVVSLEFDNKQFESATQQTMSTLDKLKAALKFPSSSKSLDSISKAAKNVDFSGMEKGIETVNARFSALQVVGMTALSNITSAAMRAGTNIVNSFTLEPVISGFKEYETQLNSVQTILANTESKGSTIDDVTKALDELNTYADQTIYNFTEMTRNIGTFTAAGVDLEKSVTSIKGIANLAAVSGSTSTQASTAMYQLSQALAAGRVSLMDWNSVVNAGMGGELFQNALKRTAKQMGTDVDALIEQYGSFRESLTRGQWLTAEVLTETLTQISGAYTEADLIAQGYSKQQAQDIVQLANTAVDAATKVKTFTQLMDTLKEAMGSGWAKTWQLIFGDFEEAKAFWTELSGMFSGIINNFSDARNNVIEAAMGGGESRWSEFTSQLDKAGASVEEFQKQLASVYSTATNGGSLDELIKDYGSLEKAIGSGKITTEMMTQALSNLATSSGNAKYNTEELSKILADYQKVVDQVWYGTYGNVDTGRVERLAAAGWEFSEVQKLVNMTVDGHRLTLEDLTEAQIISMGYTQEQAAALASLAQEASAAGQPLNDLINDLISPKKSGRELFLEGIKNLLEAIMRPLGAVAQAFSDIFAIDAGELYDMIDGFNKFSKALIMSEDDALELRRTLRGLFSIVHILTTVVGKTLVIGFKAANAILGLFGSDLLDVTAGIGTAIYAFDQWITSAEGIETVIGGLSTALSWVIGPIDAFFESFVGFPIIKQAVDALKSFVGGIIEYISNLQYLSVDFLPKKIAKDIVGVFDSIRNLKWTDILSGLREFGSKAGEIFLKIVEGIKEVGPNIIEGLQNGLMDGIEGVVDFLKELGTKIIEAICAVLGIHSPSTVFFEIGVNIVQGLVNGIKYLSGSVADVIYTLVEDIKYALSGIDWGVVIPIAGAVGAFAILYQMTDALQGVAAAAKQFSAPFQSIANLGGSLKTTVDGFNNMMGFTQNNTSMKFKQMAEGIKILAEAIAILAGSVVVLTLVDTGKMWIAVGAIGALAVIIGALAAALSHFSQGATVMQSLQLNSLLLSIAGSFLLLSVSAKILGTMDENAVDSASFMLAAFTGVVSALIGMAKFAGGKNLNLAASFLKQVSVCFLLLSASAKLLGTMDDSEMTSAGIMLAAFTGVVSALIFVTKFAGKDLRTASRFIGEVGGCFVLLGIAARLIGGMETEDMNRAVSFITLFGAVVAGLIAATKLAGDKSVDAIGSTIFKIAGAMAILGSTAIILGSVDTGQLIKGGIAVAALGVIVVGLMKLVQMIGPGEAAKVGLTLLAMSLAIGVLAGIATLLGFVDPEKLAKGVIAVSVLAAMMAVMTKATAGASDVKGSFIGMAIAIGVMAASVAVLSFIDTDRLVAATAALTVLMLALAGLAVSMWGLNDITKTLLAISLVIAILGGVLYALSTLPVNNTISSATALSAVLLAMAAACKILGTINTVSPMALAAVATLTVVVGAIAGIIYAIRDVDPVSAMGNATALSTLLLALSLACVVLGTINTVSPMALAAVATLTVVVGAIAGVIYAIRDVDPVSAMGNATALSTLLLSMSVAVAILGGIGALGPAVWNGLAALGALALGIGVIIGIVSAIASFGGDAAIEAVNKGAELFKAIGNAIGSFISGIGVGLTSGLPEIGANLSMFALQLMPFITTMKMIDASVTESCANLAGAILALTAAGVIEGLASLFGGGSIIGSVGEQLVPFGQAMADFAGTLSGVDLNALLIGSQAAKYIADMANAMPKEDGILDSIFGYSTVDLGTFGENLVQFGNGMKSYAESIAGVDVASIQNSIPAAEGLAELANKLPADGSLSLMNSIFGTKTDLSSFGTQLVDFGDGLSQYASKVADLDTEAIQNSIPAAEALNELAQKLPSDGGFVGSIFGSDGPNLGNFGGQLESFGEALGKYATSVAELDTESINTSVDATNRIIGLLRSLIGLEDIGTGIENAKKIKDLGDAIKQYGEKIADVDPTKMINSATAVNGLKDAINGLVGLDSSGITSFQTAINSLAATNVQALVDKFSSIDTSSIGANLIAKLAKGISSGNVSVASAAAQIAKTLVIALTNAGKQIAPIGLAAMTKFADGVKRGGAIASTAVRAVCTSAANAASSTYTRFYNAGAMLSAGLAAGMNSKLYQIRSAASQMANAAAKATRAAAVVRSPSRVFMEIGDYMGQGLVIGMENEQRAVYKAGYAMGDSAYNGIKSTVSRLGDVLGSDLDVNPTIRPVLDLTDVRNGANSINGMLGSTVPLNVLGRVNSIDRSMNARIQNGTFDDVVKAVDRLRGDLSQIGGPSYTINGITYDDGSNIARTVGDLTRAIRLERRV